MTTAGNAGHAAVDAARDTTDNKYFQLLGRVGLAAYGLVHFTIAYLAVRVALGASGAKADKGGALATLAAQPGGRALLWAVTVGLAVLVLWRLGEATVGLRWVQPHHKRIRKRIESALTAVVFGLLAVSAGKLAAGGGAGSDAQQKALTARVLALPLGQLLVGTVGVALLALAAYEIYRGIRKKFVEDLDLSTASPTARTAAIRLGQAGYPALGIAYGTIGMLIITMAVTYRPNKAVGLDAALTTLAAQPYGTALLLLVAAGLACFGLYCLFDARYRRG
ncbi:DUF1206 domain-containing protein [Actinoplanes aureus]|uniref:DUF1206 domain-containing protein n=1 Tax=Actinoplanes aureus TaxID=2792083 RepID=A0A931CHH6_9ACTN|nr:DUF1206 domain-containing protein [Actinoplanes aureus]MBG0567353.1 DUF1206 domain-containing protein [Actinoplanes aureus]